MLASKLFIATLKKLYENNYKNINNEEKDLRQLYVQGNLRRPAGLLHATSVWSDRFSDYNANLFSSDHGFIKRTRLTSLTCNLHT